VLAYCIAEQRSQINIPASGLEGAPVKWLDMDDLRCFVSDFPVSMPNEPAPEMVKAFHRVVRRIFAQAAVIPFRFPTIVESEAVLRQFLKNRSAAYSEALRRLRHKVQVDVRIILNPAAGAANSVSRAPSQSGKKYLEARQGRYRQTQSILDEFRRVSNSLAEEWIQRETPSGIRAFALLDRSALPAFLEKIGRVLTPADISARVTGPWPPSEFVEIAHE
jgi:Gas vesicle synthesis protein GvpL/GvpF